MRAVCVCCDSGWYIALCLVQTTTIANGRYVFCTVYCYCILKYISGSIFTVVEGEGEPDLADCDSVVEGIHTIMPGTCVTGCLCIE